MKKNNHETNALHTRSRAIQYLSDVLVASIILIG
jgi:hypothetical protein